MSFIFIQNVLVTVLFATMRQHAMIVSKDFIWMKRKNAGVCIINLAQILNNCYVIGYLIDQYTTA